MSSTKQTKVFALIDCNNFYASCECLFRPNLKTQPIIVLSKGRGCIIARSKKAKELNIPMGAPFFEYESYCKKHSVHVFEARFSTYVDLSKRVMETLSSFGFPIEIYSIDEAFLEIPLSSNSALDSLALKIKETVYQHTGIPVSVGISYTKTLAKLANYIAKSKKQNYLTILHENLSFHLKQFPIENVWGIGKATQKKLPVQTAYDFTKLDDAWIKQHFSISILRIAYELKGIAALPLETYNKTASSQVVSATFPNPIKEVEHLISALSQFCSKAGQKLRWNGLCSGQITVFIASSRFDKSPFFRSGSRTLYENTDSTIEITKAAQTILSSLYQKNISYKQMGICLTNIMPKSSTSLSFNFEPTEKKISTNLMHVIDTINNNYSQEMIKTASSISTSSQGEKPPIKSPWEHIPQINIDLPSQKH